MFTEKNIAIFSLTLIACVSMSMPKVVEMVDLNTILTACVAAIAGLVVGERLDK